MLGFQCSPTKIVGPGLPHVDVGGGGGGITPARPTPSVGCHEELGDKAKAESWTGRVTRGDRAWSFHGCRTLKERELLRCPLQKRSMKTQARKARRTREREPERGEKRNRRRKRERRKKGRKEDRERMGEEKPEAKGEEETKNDRKLSPFKTANTWQITIHKFSGNFKRSSTKLLSKNSSQHKNLFWKTTSALVAAR